MTEDQIRIEKLEYRLKKLSESTGLEALAFAILKELASEIDNQEWRSTRLDPALELLGFK